MPAKVTSELIQSIMKELGTKTFYEILLIRNELVRVLSTKAFHGDTSASELLLKVDSMTSIEQVAWMYYQQPELRKLTIDNPFEK